jgi:hypothetical protein
MQQKVRVLVGYVALMAASLSALAQSPSGTIQKTGDGPLDDSVIVQRNFLLAIGTAPDNVVALKVGASFGAAFAVVGESDTPTIGIGVRGRGTLTGVDGISVDGQGVAGASTNGVGVSANSAIGDHITAGSDPANPVFRVANNGDVYSRGQLVGHAIAVGSSDTPVMLPLRTYIPVIALSNLDAGQYIVSAKATIIRGPGTGNPVPGKCILRTSPAGVVVDEVAGLSPTILDEERQTPTGLVILQAAVSLPANGGVSIDCENLGDFSFPPPPEDWPRATLMRLFAERYQ